MSEKIASQTPDLITIPLELEINKRLNITALYLDNDALIQQVCMDMEEQTNSWDDIERFELFLGKLPVWKDKFYQLIDQREEIMERIQINSMDKRIAKLKESHFII